MGLCVRNEKRLTQRRRDAEKSMWWSRKQKGPIDPYAPRWGEVVLTGFDQKDQPWIEDED
ncbi:MAG: hypothetical protein HPKKFMNG_00670 [Planctomycetes bacterium]|nr:hypothetical protein [Planctomycetota bacterium]